METLTPRGRTTRLLITLLGAAALLAGTVWGADDHFPFGPFRMYSSAPHPSLLADVAAAYASRSPSAPRLVTIRIVIRWHEVRDSRPTGHHTDETLVTFP